MGSGIKDKVAIIGMGCSRFGERWDADTEDLMAEAFEECLKDAGIDRNRIEAAYAGTHLDAFNVGPGGTPASVGLKLPFIPVTRVENFCATGTEAFRAAAYAVASGACDIALAVGVEKLKDVGYGGVPQRTRGVVRDMYWPNLSAPGGFAQLGAGYRAKYKLDRTDIKRAMAHISVKSHQNAIKNEKAHLRFPITEEQVLNAKMIAEPIGMLDCCGVSDGASCAILTTPEIARSLGKASIVTAKALQIAASSGEEVGFSNWDGSYVPSTQIAAQRAYLEAGIKNPREEIGMTEVHDCFSLTELVTMEDLFLSKPGEAVRDVLDGRFDLDGDIPCGPDGGLKCFGHPVGATGLRMIYECYNQLLGRAGERQISDPKLCLTHNLGGFPFQNATSVAIFGMLGS
jgi:acetyl-CoA C-acetyltransferase